MSLGRMIKVDDPRNALEKARRQEMVEYARANSIDIDPDMPAILMRKVFRQRGIHSIPIPQRTLGMPEQRPMPQARGPFATPGAAAAEPDIPVMDAEDDLARQYQAEQRNAALMDKPVKKMDFNELRRAAKMRGIGIARGDTARSLRTKIRRHDENSA